MTEVVRPQETSDKPSALGAYLTAVRRRLVMRRVLRGAFGAAAVLGTAALAVFAADRLTLFPRFLRLVAAGVFSAGTALLVYRRIIAPVVFAPNAAGAADHLETLFPRLGGFALSAAELAVLRDTRSSAPSQTLVEMTVEEALERLERLPAHSGARASGVLKPLAAALAAAVLWAVTACTFPAETLVFLRRFAFPLRHISYPARTRIVAIEAPDVVAQGDGFTARLAAEGALPAQAAFEIASASGRARRMYVTGRGGTYELTLESVRESFSLAASVGDARSRSHEVRVVPRPKVTAISTDVTYPPYTNLAPAALAGGHVSAPVASKARVRARLNKPVRTVEAIFEGDDVIQAEVAPAGGEAHFDFEVAAVTTYRLRIRDEYGFENADQGIYRVTAEPDLGPLVRLREPGRDLSVVPGAVVPVEGEAVDDFGIRLAGLRYSIERAGEEAREGEILLAAKSPPEPTVSLSHRWDLTALALEPGDELTYHLTAEDNLPGSPQSASSERRRLRVVTVAEKLAEIERMTRQIQANLKNIERRQEGAKDSLQDTAPSGGGPPA